ncbi:MAG: 3'-5' exonuclease [Kiritimatiellia bacterium]
MEWLPKYNKLDPAQLQVIQQILGHPGNHFVEGFPGTGKSVVLAHAAMRCQKQSQRGAIILTYTNALVACISEGVTTLPVMTIDHFVDNPQPHTSIFVDEAQDLSTVSFLKKKPTLSILRSHAERLIFAADSAQSLYEDRIPVETLKQEFGVTPQRCYHLRVNYRMTKKMLNVLDALFPDRKLEVSTGSLVDDVDVVYGDAHTQTEEYAWVFRKAKEYAEPRDPAVILFPTIQQMNDFVADIAQGLPELSNRGSYTERQTRRQEFNQACIEQDLPLRFLGNGIGEFSESDAEAMVYLMTMHSAKGLDFKTVLVPNCQEIPSNMRNLYYVALSRARSNLFLSAHGDSAVKAALRNLARIVPATAVASTPDTPDASDFPF